MSACFSSLFSDLLHSVLWLILEGDECHVNVSLFFLSSFVNEFGMTAKNLGEMASVLKIIILSSNKNILLFRKRETWCMFFTVTRQLFYTLRVSLYEKWTPKILIVSVVKLIDFKLQTASKTPFREPSLAISHLLEFDLSPQKRVN